LSPTCVAVARLRVEFELRDQPEVVLPDDPVLSRSGPTATGCRQSSCLPYPDL